MLNCIGRSFNQNNIICKRRTNNIGSNSKTNEKYGKSYGRFQTDSMRTTQEYRFRACSFQTPNRRAHPHFSFLSSSYCTIQHPSTSSQNISYANIDIRDIENNLLRLRSTFDNRNIRTHDRSYFPGQVRLDPDDWRVDVRHTVVEYIENNVTDVGLLSRPKGKRKWIIQGADGIERSINKYHITFQWPNTLYQQDLRDSLDMTFKSSACTLDDLKAIKRECKALLDSLPPHVHNTIWILFYDVSNENDKAAQPIQIYQLAKSLFNLTKPHDIHIYTLHTLLNSHKRYFIYSLNKGFFCREMDKVADEELSERFERDTEIYRKQFLEKIRQRLSSTDLLEETTSRIPILASKTKKEVAQGSVERPYEDIKFNEYDLKLLFSLKQFALASQDDHNNNLYKNILEPLGFGDRPHDAYKILQKLGIISPTDNPFLLRWPYMTTFSEEEEELAKNIIKENLKVDTKNRMDLRGYPVFCIDREDADEIDDGISFVTDEESNEWVYIHVADVSNYIQPNSTLDLIARERSSSIYLPDRTFGMFPKILADFMSLQPGKEQPALSFGALIGPSGKIEQMKVVHTVIDSVQHITHNDLDEIVHSTSEQKLKPKLAKMKKEFYFSFMKLAEYATKRRAYRLDNQCVVASVASPDVRVRIDSSGYPTAIVKPSGNFYKNAKGIVTEFMLMASEIAAEYCHKKNLPIFYRSQKKAYNFKPENLESAVYFAQVVEKEKLSEGQEIIENINALKSLKPQIISTISDKHGGYGLNRFTNVTSPIRRYFDLIVQYQISAALLGENPPFDYFELGKSMSPYLKLSNEIREFQSKCDRYWVLNSIEELVRYEPKRKFDAIVTKPRDFLNDDTEIFLTDFGLTNAILPNRNYNRGEAIQVTVDLVNPFYNSLVLRETERKNNKRIAKNRI